MANGKGHKWFAAVWSVQTRHEPAWLKQWRNDAAGGATGRVLEIGCGAGTNFAYYGSAATQVVATEPDPYMMTRARESAAAFPDRLTVGSASAEDLPFADETFDSVVSTFNFCSIPDPARALSEVRRVLKTGGEYRFFDHVRYHNSFAAWVQDTVTPVWTWCGGGCHPNRDIEAMIVDAGLAPVQIERVKPLPPIPPVIILRPCIRGVAVRT
jgi:SAM-dependent methyltransferase